MSLSIFPPLIMKSWNQNQSIGHAYLRGVWDSVKGVSLIFIVCRDTYGSNALQTDKPNIEADDSSSSSNSQQTTAKRSSKGNAAVNRRELNKLKEYVFVESITKKKHNHFICIDFQHYRPIPSACVIIVWASNEAINYSCMHRFSVSLSLL